MSLQGLLAELISDDESRAERAALQISELGEDSIPVLLELTLSPNADHRWWAVRTLALSPHTPTSKLVALLSDTSADVRAAVLLALREHPTEEAIPALIEILKSKDTLLSQLSANVLIAIGGMSVPALLEVIETDNQAARIQAMRALAELCDHRAIKTMMKVMDEESSLLQYWAQEGLEKLGLNMVYIKP
jgi:HEAT repeat protein